MSDPESLLPLVESVRARYGARPSDAELGEMLNLIAWTANGNRADGPWGLSRKTGGTHVEGPPGVGPIAHDILHHRPSNLLFDVFTAAGAESQPTWNRVGPPQSADRVWVAPVRPAGTTPAPGPSTPPQEPPAPPPGPNVEAIVRSAVDAAVAPLRGRLDQVERDALRYGARIGLRTDAGFTVCAEGGGSGEVNATRRDVGAWETFTVERP